MLNGMHHRERECRVAENHEPGRTNRSYPGRVRKTNSRWRKTTCAKTPWQERAHVQGAERRLEGPLDKG